MRLLGLDPGLQRTGWGMIDVEGSHIRHLAHGVITSDRSLPLASRLMQLHDGIMQVIDDWQPDEAAVEETFVNKNPNSTLKLGQARGVAILVPALKGVVVAEYAPNAVKKAIVGSGHAGKEQILAMVQMLLPGVKVKGQDAADALALAICHSRHAGTARNLARAIRMAT